MVRIVKRRVPDGTYYEIADFEDYVQALKEHGIEPPMARYRIFVAADNAHDLSRTVGNIESEVEAFFNLGPATQIECEVVDA
jgi:hypothetical protein